MHSKEAGAGSEEKFYELSIKAVPKPQYMTDRLVLHGFWPSEAIFRRWLSLKLKEEAS